MNENPNWENNHNWLIFINSSMHWRQVSLANRGCARSLDKD